MKMNGRCVRADGGAAQRGPQDRHLLPFCYILFILSKKCLDDRMRTNNPQRFR